MTRSQRVAALTVGAVLVVGIPVAGAHQAPPPDLGGPVVVGRTDPAPATGSEASPGDGATEHDAPRSPSPSATKKPWHEDGDDMEDVAPTVDAGSDYEDADRSPSAQPVSPKPPAQAGTEADDDTTTAGTPEATAVSVTPSASASDDGGEGDDDGGDDDSGEDG
ncbi:hypothetical protein AB0I98_31980 [Streptomyces sp. NPDC050211]|uniref:hypothetical protein n=1 Tax=Streptomyces sp. NPDC050211 TaxID=3154932 RepID=UPI00343D60F6